MATSANVAQNLSRCFSPKLSFSPSPSPSSVLQFIRLPIASIAAKPLTSHAQCRTLRTAASISHASASSSSTPSSADNSTTFHGLCCVVGEYIDSDQIIPAEYLTLVPSIGDDGPVIEAAGNFAYARQTGMISSHSA